MFNPIKTGYQIRKLGYSAGILYGLFEELSQFVSEGKTGLDVQNFALFYLKKNGAQSVLKGYNGFQADISISVNSTAVHGLPDNRTFIPGDLVTIDSSIIFEGWYGDMAWTFGIPPLNAGRRRLIRAAWQACIAGCLSLQCGVPLGTIGGKIIDAANGLGTNVVHQFCGHGIGKELHEAPLIPYTKNPGFGWKVEQGMVLNIEPVVTLGNVDVKMNADNGSCSTEDGSHTAQFELTCAVSKAGLRFLSLPGIEIGSIIEYPPF